MTSFLFHKIFYYGIDEGNLMFENQSKIFLIILQLAILLFLKI